MDHPEASRAARASPAWIVNVAIGVALVLSALLIGAAEGLPALPFRLAAEGERVVATGFASRETKSVISAVRAGADAEPFELEAIDLIEEPDVVSSWAELDDFYARQGELWKRLSGPALEVKIGDRWHVVDVKTRTFTELPLEFYTMLVACLVVWVAGFVTYALSDRGLAARIYAVSAVAFCIAVWPAALYATRPLAIEPQTFRLLSTIDHLGGLWFAGGTVALLAVYPVRLLNSISWFWVMGGLAALAGHYQIGDMSLTGFYTFNAMQFVMFLGFGAWQWRASRSNPIHRAALGWILLSVFAGVIFFFTLITLPVLLGQPPTISQTTGFVCIVLMYVGISLGVLRFRLFELDRWWFRTWSWILSGAAVVGADLLLTRLFELEHEVALIVALVVVGWIYFPIRQRLFERFGRVGRIGQKSAAYDARELITAASPQELEIRFERALKAVFAPLEVVRGDEAIDAPRIDGEGAWLSVPSPEKGRCFRCHFRDNGARLFTREDVARASELSTLGESVRAALEARSEGENAERTRIRRDLHDDLAASIIRIAHEARDEHTASLAKAAMSDLRDVLTALQDKPSPHAEALEDLEADLRARAQAHGRVFEWVVRGESNHVLSARTRANLTRALRETLTNALKHGSGTIRYDFEIGEAALKAVITNGTDGDGPIEAGMGIENISSRLAELGGKASFSRTNGCFEFVLELPWRSDT